MNGVELRDIRTFLVLAEELHFGRAADRLGVTGSRVSQVIRRLEGRVGGRLFDRSSHIVRLTMLGERVRDGLRPAHREFHRVIEEVRAGGAVEGRLRVGLYSYFALRTPIIRAVQLFEERHPGWRAVLRQRVSVHGLLDMLRAGDLDLAIVRLPLDEPGVTIGPTLAVEERALAVARGDPLTLRGHADLEDLAGRETIGRPAGCSAVHFDFWIPPRTPLGRPIHRRHAVDDPLGILPLVADGEIVHPTVASAARYYRHPGVAYVPLRGLPPFENALVWPVDEGTVLGKEFAAAAAEVGASAGS